MAKTLNQLENIRTKMAKEMQKIKIFVCCGTGCTSSKSPKIIEEFNKIITERNLKNVTCEKTGCFGFCAKGPIVVVEPEEVFYEFVKPEDVEEIIVSHIIGNKVVERLMPKENGEFIKKWHDLNFYKKQMRIALKNCGNINPENIDEYIGMDGYKALEKCLTKMSCQEVVDEVKESMIRGRGGAGFPSGIKWQTAKDSAGDQKYVICNADEGDPGAFMDRSILEGDPHSVLEAMEICAYAIGASKGFIYVRAEYPIAVERLKIAINQAREYGILGKNIFGTDFCFDIELRLGAGAFVCGEETALINSVEGRRGEPKQKPPFPAVSGAYDSPTIINNVETLANIPQIITKGAKWFSSIGTEKSKGTKVFALGGNIKNVGLVEVPMGTTLREIIYDIGGGIPNNKKFKAAQTGGPSGGCIPEQYLDTPIDYDSLTAIGSMMGSGGLIVMDEDTCMVNIAKFFLAFTVDESCGKCTPCRIGTKRMLEILERITTGKGVIEDIEKMEFLAAQIKKASLCALGQSACNPVLSTLKYFKQEYIDHIENKICAAGTCVLKKPEDLVVEINPDICKQCGICQKNCPVGAIVGEVRKGPFKIDKEKCIKCGACVAKCPFKAIKKY